MDKVYDHTKVEEPLYKRWEENGYFKPEVNPEGKPYSIILPPPNANAPLHFGHAMYVIEDILVRFHRMKGYKTLWEPGADHAGFETQFVYEKKLAEKGKSRFDYDRETLFKDIWDFVHENRGGMESQLRKLGFSLDWSRLKFTIDPDIVKIVYKNFKKLYDDGLVYRAERLVNYCTYDGTSFSDLEVVHEERKSPLYYIKYGPLILATTRPETKFGDTAVAVNPKDKRYEKYVGQEIEIETVLGKAKIKVIADDMVDPDFGTGVVKITPAHDFNDFETGKRHNLPMKQVIGFDGKMNHHAGKFEGLYVKQARKAIVAEMQEKGLMEKIDENYVNRVGLCYKCKNILEPLPLEQWFVKMEPLAKPAIDAVKNGDIKIFPKNYEKLYFQFLENIRDWNISRQVVWGIRIPAWYKVDGHEERIAVSFVNKNGEFKPMRPISQAIEEGATLEEIEKGIQRVRVMEFQGKNNPELTISENKPDGGLWIQETDTFDTWFSSSQWPFATLMTTNDKDYETFYPTSVMETGYDILRWWVARMVMMGIYATGKVPFKHVVLHGLVNDPYGKKMSKSKGNVVNPIELCDQYGADAVRFALVYGTALGNDQALSYPKLEAARKFSNKLWNIGRYAEFYLNSDAFKGRDIPFYDNSKNLKKEDKEILNELNTVTKNVSSALDEYRFQYAADNLYEFVWHVLADKYMEQIKERLRNGDDMAMSVFRHVFLNILKLLHPIMPFITEDLWSKMPRMKDEMLMISSWPEV